MTVDMSPSPALVGMRTEALRQASVSRVEGDGTVVVEGSEDGGEVLCVLLVTAGATFLSLCPGDQVLVWQPNSACTGVVLGRIGPSHSPDTPDSLVLEATHSLTLRVGDGSITIRADGKILIKGKDLVSHAQRVNRIKGGSVAIN